MFFILHSKKMDVFIGDLNKEHMVIQLTDKISLAKKFKTKKAAEKFAAEWKGAGVGMPKDAKPFPCNVHEK